MCLDDPSYETQSQAESLFWISRRYAIEAVEDVRQMVRRDSYAGIFDYQFHLIVLAAELHFDLASSGRILDRISQKIRQHALNLNPIGINQAGFRQFSAKPDALCLGRNLVLIHQ